MTHGLSSMTTLDAPTMRGLPQLSSLTRDRDLNRNAMSKPAQKMSVDLLDHSLLQLQEHGALPYRSSESVRWRSAPECAAESRGAVAPAYA